MKFEEIERSVISKDPLPASGSFEETVCFTALRSLYNDFHKQYITKDQAIKERVQLKKQYQHMVWLHSRYSACMAQFQEFIHDAERYRPDILNALKERVDDCTIMKMMIDCIGSMCHDPVFVKSAYRLLEDMSG